MLGVPLKGALILPKCSSIGRSWRHAGSECGTSWEVMEAAQSAPMLRQVWRARKRDSKAPRRQEVSAGIGFTQAAFNDIGGCWAKLNSFTDIYIYIYIYILSKFESYSHLFLSMTRRESAHGWDMMRYIKRKYWCERGTEQNDATHQSDCVCTWQCWIFGRWKERLRTTDRSWHHRCTLHRSTVLSTLSTCNLKHLENTFGA